VPKLYVASSWRNIYQPKVVRIARALGHEVYDFRNPAPGNDGFRWKEIDDAFASWDFKRYRKALEHKIARSGFKLDMDALRWCDACLLVLPSGRSAHLELGYAVGAGKLTALLYPEAIEHPKGTDALQMFGHTLSDQSCASCGDLDGCWLPAKLKREFEPELMVKMCDSLLYGERELREWLRSVGDLMVDDA
jgi:hypothetical protein